jgi:glycopeptide antibiotics resistance protein
MFADARAGLISPRVVTEQIRGNILLTVPFGVGIGLLTRRRGWEVVRLALIADLALEGTQLLFKIIGVRHPFAVDINDVLLNALGVVVGYGVCLLARRGVQMVRIYLGDRKQA